MSEFLPAHDTSALFGHGLQDGLECLRVVHGEVGENFTVETDVLLGQLAHELGIGDTPETAGSVDTLDPEGAEIALLGPAVTIGVGETFFVGVLCNSPDIPPGEEVAAGLLEDLLAARS